MSRISANRLVARGLQLSLVLCFLIVAARSAKAQTAYNFVPVNPCRIADTRNAEGTFGGPSLASGSTRSFPIPSSSCGVPSNAAAYSLNVTVVPVTTLGYISLWPTGEAQPLVSTLNSLDGRIKANAAIVPAGTGGAVSIYATDPTQVILDINGYFATTTVSTALAFYPVTPCRIADTRNPAGPLGGPSLVGGQVRSLPLLSACSIPSTAQAYSLNFTAIPHTTLGYLSVWPAGQPQPLVSTLNALTGRITANGAIVPAGTNGAVDLFVTDNSDMVIDVSGYFAPPGPGGLSLYPLAPCRVLDTRQGGVQPFSGTLNVTVSGFGCVVPTTAQAYVLNATVVPPSSLGYLTLWPEGVAQPLVSTLNATDGAITSNMAIVSTINGSISTYASDPTQLVLDISGYFAPSPTVTVDFSKSIAGQKSMSGFLHGIDVASPPPNSLLAPLAPHLWRGNFGGPFDSYNITQSLGVGTIWDGVASDTYGYPINGGWSTTGSTVPPYDNAPYDNNFVPWEQLVQGLANQYGSRQGYWEVWNEPDNLGNPPQTGVFWYGTAQQFYQTYLVAYQILRAQLGPNAMIVGPSPTHYDKTLISGLLDFCVANGCEVNVLSWHESNDNAIPAIAQDIQDARNTLVQNPKYASLNIQQIDINESGGPSADYEPGDILAYLYFLEQGGADAAAKACWIAADGTSECFNNSLDGLIDPASLQPRAPWWTYKLYADGVSTRVPVQYTNSDVVALASTGSATTQTAQVLVGYFNDQNPPATANILIQLSNLGSLSFLNGLSQVQVHVQKIPNSGEQDLSALTEISNGRIAIQNNSLQLSISGIALHEAYVISISP